ncbi:Endolytic peptidoglycan transglycosylase RlpA [Candidatus Desulfarcum epimagneticum]|uniref:Probable endolytic peptidoglycan transglycosylase RlpA n=1 Tax=uncultured Desulfobacteraceae bacterium TaxID=218296 RepID=A0A484HE76_9BACT|nr:Endolytic peptidoglycan transglycosylase RlpA [uncultured Desulfobacteraceae bacterium]
MMRATTSGTQKSRFLFSSPVLCLVLAALTPALFLCAGGCGAVRSSASSMSGSSWPGPSEPAPPKPQKPYVVMGKEYRPIPLEDAAGFRQQGLASWYGEDFHGRKTANGEIYNMHAMTAAHKTLPLGAHIRVKNLKNNRKVEVRVNDRGPFVRGRIVDLSYRAAKKLDMVDSGTAPVEVVALGFPTRGPGARPYYSRPKSYQVGDFTIQVGAFREKENAERLLQILDKTYNNAHVSDFNDGKDLLYRVRVGKCSTLEKAKEYESVMIEKGFKGAFVVAE